MSDNEIIIVIIIIVVIVNKICGEQFLVKLLSALFAWTPTVKLYLTRLFSTFSSVGFISYRTFPATEMMSLCAALLKVISLQYNHLNRTNCRSVYMKFILFCHISLRSVLILSHHRNIDLHCGTFFSGFPTQDCYLFITGYRYTTFPGHAIRYPLILTP
jgi:hypothetical protein